MLVYGQNYHLSKFRVDLMVNLLITQPLHIYNFFLSVYCDHSDYCHAVYLYNVRHVWKWKVLKGSHKCGRIDHLIVAEQTGADVERVQEIEKVCDLIHVELKAGYNFRPYTLGRFSSNNLHYLTIDFQHITTILSF